MEKYGVTYNKVNIRVIHSSPRSSISSNTPTKQDNIFNGEMQTVNSKLHYNIHGIQFLIRIGHTLHVTSRTVMNIIEINK